MKHQAGVSYEMTPVPLTRRHWWLARPYRKARAAGWRRHLMWRPYHYKQAAHLY